VELPGHADDVFTVDWSPGGDKVVSGGRDMLVKMYCFGLIIVGDINSIDFFVFVFWRGTLNAKMYRV
jgi:WD40 repeat protein